MRVKWPSLSLLQWIRKISSLAQKWGLKHLPGIFFLLVEFQLVSKIDWIRTEGEKISLCGQMNWGIISALLEFDIDQRDRLLLLPILLFSHFVLVGNKKRFSAKILESPLDSKEIKLVHPKGNQSWIFIGRTDAEAETNTLATWCKELTHWKRPWCWERLREGGDRVGEDAIVRSHHWLSAHETGQNPGESKGQGSLACCSPRGHEESDVT